MKKFITAAALIAAGTAFANAATVVLDSVLTGVGTYASAGSVSAWDALYGKTTTEAVSVTGISGAGKAGSAEGLTYVTDGSGSRALKSYTFNDLFVSSGTIDSSASYTVKSIQFITRPDGYNQQSITLQLKDSNGTVVAESGTVSYETHTTDTYEAATATFTSVSELDLSTAYTIEFNGSSATEGFGEFKTTFDHNNGYEIDGSHFYTPVIRVTLATIPEPSAFGLIAGAGALALVASRRRRRAK